MYVQGGRIIGAQMEPFLALFLLPVLFGVAAARIVRETRHASLLAAIASTLLVYVWVEWRDPAGTWNWLVALLVSPLVIAFSLTAVFVCYGRSDARKRGGNGA
jgi:hypothetical protein